MLSRDRAGLPGRYRIAEPTASAASSAEAARKQRGSCRARRRWTARAASRGSLGRARAPRRRRLDARELARPHTAASRRATAIASSQRAELHRELGARDVDPILAGERERDDRRQPSRELQHGDREHAARPELHCHDLHRDARARLVLLVEPPQALARRAGGAHSSANPAPPPRFVIERIASG